MQQQFQVAMQELQRQNTELQTALANSQQQAASELETLRQEVREVSLTGPARGSPSGGYLGVDTRLLGKPCDFQRDPRCLA